MTPQEIFNTVAKHLIAQGQPAMDMDEDGELQCMYRAPDGSKCAFGVLIPDEIYESWMEGKNPGSLIAMIDDLAPFKEHDELIADLQWAHDNWAWTPYCKCVSKRIDALVECLRIVASCYKLSPAVLG